MRVLMINVVCGIRSTGRICTDIAEQLEKQGHDVKIAYGREDVPDQYKKYAVRIDSDIDIAVNVVKSRLYDAEGFGARRATKSFIKWVRSYDPDVIHLHNLHGYYINIEILFDYLKNCGKRIVWTLHDCWPFTGHSAFCDAIDCRKWVTGCSRCPQTMEYPKSYVDRSTRNWIKKKKAFNGIENLQIVTPSKWLAGLVKDSYLKKYSVAVINNGIDTSKFYPLRNDFKEFYHLEDKFIILAVASSWSRMKGLDDYITLSKMLDVSFQIVMVGLGEKQIKALPPEILGIKKTASTKELAMMYSCADVFLNLTYVDTYPTVNVEAEACGAKVVTYDTGGNSESAVNACVIAKGDIQAVAKTLKVMAENKKNQKGDTESNKKLKTSLVKDMKCTAEEYISKYNLEGYFRIKCELGLLGMKVVLAVSATWEPRKGFKDIIMIAKRLPNDYRIAVIGVDHKQKKELPENIIIINRTNDIGELQNWYSVADVFLNPTYEDNYPSTNLEAISSGTSVISYDTGGSGESAKMYGKIVNKGDWNSMINDICTQRVLQVSSDVYMGGGTGCEKVSYKYMVDEYMGIYR